ncbi:MAG: MlaD family protein [Myxococcales bacterium]
MKKGKDEALRAGIFVLAGVVFLTIAIFALGRKSALFSRTTTLYASFDDLSGLTVGTPVKLAGLEIGSVTALSFPPELERKETRVRLEVQSKYMSRIRSDSRVFIDSAGLLGDKVVNISMGDAKRPMLEDGDSLAVGRSVSFEQISENADRVIQSLGDITASLDNLIRDQETQALPREASRAASSLAHILSAVEHGPGLAHRVIYDPAYAADMESILASTRGLAKSAASAVARVDHVVNEVEHGQGTLHELVYGAQGKRALDELANAAHSIDEVVSQVQSGDGVLHTLVYSQDKGNFLEELNQMSATLNRIVQDVDRGRGTVGGLVRDPTVYEDLKRTLGDVERNVIFKALVRMTVDKDHLRRTERAPTPVETTP